MYLHSPHVLVNNHQVGITSCKICAMKHSMGWKKKKCLVFSLLKSMSKVLRQGGHYSLFHFPFLKKNWMWHQTTPESLLCAFLPISPTLLRVHLPNSAWCWHLGSLNLTLQGAYISEKSANTKNQGVFSSFQAAGNETFPNIHWLFPPRLRWFRVMLIEQMHVKEGVKAET